LESVGFERRRHDNVRVNDKSKRNHLRLVFLSRAALMMLSICCETRASVLFAFDSLPMIVRTWGCKSYIVTNTEQDRAWRWSHDQRETGLARMQAGPYHGQRVACVPE